MHFHCLSKWPWPQLEHGVTHLANTFSFDKSVLTFWDRVSCRVDWPQTHNAAWDGIKLLMPMPLQFYNPYQDSLSGRFVFNMLRPAESIPSQYVLTLQSCVVLEFEVLDYFSFPQMPHGFIILMTSCALDLLSPKQQLVASVFQRVRQKCLKDSRTSKAHG